MQNSIALKEKIIKQSLKLFSLKGFLSTSIHDIMREVKASKGGLCNHFKITSVNGDGLNELEGIHNGVK